MKQPVFFISHGGGPWPWVEAMRVRYRATEAALAGVVSTLPQQPKAIAIVTAHWITATFSMATHARPGMIYDYGGFPEHTYEVQYPAPNSAEVCARLAELAAEHGLTLRADPNHGFDHGVFVPLHVMRPQADIPVLSLSIQVNYDYAQHVAYGRMLAALRDEGVLLVCSGLNYHNMRGFGRAESLAPAQAFNAFLNDALTQATGQARIDALAKWDHHPAARLVHPEEDHLVPLFVAVGAAGDDPGQVLVEEMVMGIPMVSWRFG